VFGVHLPSHEFAVTPGQSLSIPVLLYNQSAEDQNLTLSIRGVPSTWLSVPSPLVHLAPGEQRQVVLTVQPPAFPDGRAGRHALVIHVASQQAPAEALEETCTLTVAALEVPGRIGVLLAATEFSVLPGGNITIPLVLRNQGLDADTFALSVDGIPSVWVYAPTAAVSLAPGQQQEVSLTIQPPVSDQARAGRHSFRILVSSRGAPGQIAEAACILTIAPLTRFGGELQPQRVEAGQPARILIENQGNVQQTFMVDLQSPGGEVTFEPEATPPLRVPPGEVGLVEFVARPRSRPFLGGEVSLPFTARVQAPDQQSRNLSGELVTRGLLPTWLLPAVGIALLALIVTLVLVAVLGSGSDATPTLEPPTEAPPAVETEAPPTEAPTEVPTEPAPEPTQEPTPEQPTEPPPEQPTEEPTQEPPPEQPTEEPTQEPPPEQPTEEPPSGGEGEGPGLPCLPAALGLMLVPLLVKGKKNG
jgi:hypothetical protein